MNYLSIVFVLSLVLSAYGQSDVGGTAAPPGRYPYQGALRRKGKFICGVSVINERWLLTAAHCFAKFNNTSEATVLLGTNKVTGENGMVYAVSHLVKHERYDKDFIHGHDIALIRLDKNIKFTDRIQPVKLPRDNLDDYENATAILAGWGTFTNQSGPPKDLQHVKLTVINHDNCVKDWKKERNRDVRATQICTSGKVEENLATHGDSGGPLVSDGVQIGVVSFAWQNLPDVFTRVSAYLPWIQSHTMIK